MKDKFVACVIISLMGVFTLIFFSGDASSNKIQTPPFSDAIEPEIGEQSTGHHYTPSPKKPHSAYTFTVEDIEMYKNMPEQVNSSVLLKTNFHCDSKLEDYSHKSELSSDNFLPPQISSLLDTIHWAFISHIPLKLQPSDFILLIGQGLSKHINKYPEELRYQFVDWEGKQKIQIRRDQYVMGANNDWSDVFPEFSSEIQKRILSDVYKAILDDTESAAPNAKIASEITLMDAMKSYFKYEVMTGCGMAAIHLVGDSADWQKLIDKVELLEKLNEGNQLKLDFWLKHLVPTVKKIANTAINRDQPDIEFWKFIYKYSSGGSGGPRFSGWINTFIPYLQFSNGDLAENPNMDWKQGLKTWQEPFAGTGTDVIPSGASEVPFVWNYYGTEYPMTFYGGILGSRYNEQEGYVENVFGWAVAFDNEDE